MSYRYDEKSDTLYIFQDYQGIFGDELKDTLTTERHSFPDISSEVEQLDSVLNRERTFFFLNWIYEYDRERLLDYAKELSDSAGRKENGWKDGDEGYKQIQKLINLVVANVKVENGPFYFDENKRLCGVQRVTFTKVSEFLRITNEILRRSIKEEIEGDENKTEENRKALLRVAERQKEFVALRGNRLSLVFPISKEDYENQLNPKGDDVELLNMVKKCGGKVEFKDNAAHITLGSIEEKVTFLRMPVAKARPEFKGSVTNAVTEVKKRALILKEYDVNAAREKFLESGN